MDPILALASFRASKFLAILTAESTILTGDAWEILGNRAKKVVTLMPVRPPGGDEIFNMAAGDDPEDLVDLALEPLETLVGLGVSSFANEIRLLLSCIFFSFFQNKSILDPPCKLSTYSFNGFFENFISHFQNL
jgi:hypothetical protein